VASIPTGRLTTPPCSITSVVTSMDREFPASPTGYRALLDWLREPGELDRVGLEGTGTYGAPWLVISATPGCSWSRSTVRIDEPDGLTAHRTPLDAYSAARAALSGAAGGAEAA